VRAAVPLYGHASAVELPALEDQVRKAKYGLDKPLVVQYVNYLGGVVRGDLGPSLKYKNKTVLDIIQEGFPKSLILGLSALVIAGIVGVAFESFVEDRLGSVVEKGYVPEEILFVVLTMDTVASRGMVKETFPDVQLPVGPEPILLLLDRVIYLAMNHDQMDAIYGAKTDLIGAAGTMLVWVIGEQTRLLNSAYHLYRANLTGNA